MRCMWRMRRALVMVEMRTIRSIGIRSYLGLTGSTSKGEPKVSQGVLRVIRGT